MHGLFAKRRSTPRLMDWRASRRTDPAVRNFRCAEEKEFRVKYFPRVLSVILVAIVQLGFWEPASAQFFETRGSFPAVGSPRFVAVGDFNRDGKQDIVLTEDINSEVAVLLGNGDGTFQPGVYYALGEGPSSVRVADFNGDGYLDLVVAGGQSIGILLGNGDGTFAPESEISFSLYPTEVTVADFNGDHLLDLVTVDSTGNCPCFSVFLGNGDGTFQPPITTRPPITPDALGVGDFNHDGRLDVATAGQFLATSKVTIYLGNGDGTFNKGLSYLIGSSPRSVAVGDFRHNGILDLAIADAEGLCLSVLLGNGDGTFQQPETYSTLFPFAVATGDFNRDGHLDLVAANSGSSEDSAGATVFLGNGDGTFQAGLMYPSGRIDWYVAVADFNNDGWPDLALADEVGEAADVLLNTGVVSFSPSSPLQFPNQLLNITSSAKSVTLTNTGTSTLSITSITVSGSQYQLDSGTTCDSSVAPGASCQIAITFTPQTKGLKAGLISIADSASKKSQVIELHGAGTVVTLFPTHLKFPPPRNKGRKARRSR